jgi:hypothetical protein
MVDSPIETKRDFGRVAKIGRLSLARLREVLSYDPHTGIFKWRIRLSPNAMPGTVAGNMISQGHWRIRIDGQTYYAHQLAWLYHYGVPPSGLLDHKNTLMFDNRIANLRPATSSQNAMNRNPRTRFKGVKFQYGRYHASIRSGNNERPYLGSFATAEEAHAAYCAKASELHGDFMRIRMSTFETRQQLRAWAKDKPEEMKNRVWVACANLYLYDRGDNTPLCRKLLAGNMQRLAEPLSQVAR